MAYCTLKYVVERLTESVTARLSNDIEPSKVNEIIVNDFINDASFEIDNYLRNRYSLPLANEYSNIKNICFVLVKYKLNTRRNPASDELTKELTLATDELMRLQKGYITLNEPTPTSNQIKPDIDVIRRRPIFSERTLENFRSIK